MRRSVSWCAQSRDSKATFNNNLMQTWHYTFGPHAPQTQVLCGFLNRPTAATVEDGSNLLILFGIPFGASACESEACAMESQSLFHGPIVDDLRPCLGTVTLH